MPHSRAVVFDLFETLVTEFDPHWRPVASPASQLGVPDVIFNDVWRSRKADRMTATVDFREILREACRAADLVIDQRVDKIIESLHVQRLAAKAKPFLAVDRRVLAMLARLRTEGFKLGVLSNCAVEEVAAWPDSPLASWFDDVVFSYQVGFAKPDPRIYGRVCDGLGVTADRVTFVGDGGSDELAGARRAGMTPYRARWFLDQWPQQYRDHQVERQRGFPALLSPDELLERLD
jgi:putative hydrolase of the HAD superfamily